MDGKRKSLAGALLAPVALGCFLQSAAAQRSGTFEVRNELRVTLPAPAKEVRLWFVLPRDDPAQQVQNLKIEAPCAYGEVRDSESNRLVYLETTKPAAKVLTLRMTFTLIRKEVRSGADPARAKPLSREQGASMQQYLAPNKYIPINAQVRETADKVVGSETNPVRAARRIYDWVIAKTDYWAKDPERLKGTEEGSATYCLSSRTGNCGDMSSLWIAIARAN